MARTYRRDSRGRFAGGGGGGGSGGKKTTASGKRSGPVAPAPPTGLRFQTGERLRAGLAKATASQLAALSNTAYPNGQLDRAIRAEQNRRARSGSTRKRSTPKRAGRTVEQRLERSRKMRETAVNAPMMAASGMTKRRNTGKRLEQHRQAVANYMKRQTGTRRQRAEKTAGWWASST